MGRAGKRKKYNHFQKIFISPHRVEHENNQKGQCFKNFSQWVEHGKSVFKTIFKNFLSLNVKKLRFCRPIFHKNFLSLSPNVKKAGFCSPIFAKNIAS